MYNSKQFEGDTMEILNKIEGYLSKDLYEYSFFQIYSFTTENINGYMQFFELKDKSLLTVGSSSDQAINATLVRCNDITGGNLNTSS